MDISVSNTTTSQRKKKYDWTVDIDDEAERTIRIEVARSSLVKDSILYMVSQVMGNGVSIVSEGENQKEKDRPSEIFQRYIDEELDPFLREAIAESFVTGIIVWGLRKSELIKNFSVPALLRQGSYRVRKNFKQDKRSFSVMRIEYRDGVPVNEGLDFKESADAYVTPVSGWEPDDAGKMRSPVSNALQDIALHNKLMEGYRDSIDDYCKPLLIFEQGEPRPLKANGPFETDIVSQGDVLNKHAENVAYMNKHSQAMQTAALYSHKMNQLGYDIKYDPVSQHKKARKAEDMLDHTYMNPIGFHLSHTVTPQAIPEIVKMEENLTSKIVEILGLPAGSRYKTVTMHAPLVEMTMRQYNDRIRNIKETFAIAFSKIIRRMFRVTIVKDQMEDFDKATSLKNRAQLEAINSVIEDKTEEAESMFKYVRSLRIPENRFDQRFLQLQVKLDVRPMTTLVNLQTMHNEYLISTETYAKYAGSMLSIDSHELLTDDEERKKEIKRRRIEKELMMPPEQEKTNNNNNTPSQNKNKEKPSSVKQ